MTPPADPGEVSDGFHTFNELYEHRHALFMALLRIKGGVISQKHSDGSSLEGWFIAQTLLNYPLGAPTQISYHLPMRLWEQCLKISGVESAERAWEWDGHSSSDVVKRLKSFALNRVIEDEVMITEPERAELRAYEEMLTRHLKANREQHPSGLDEPPIPAGRTQDFALEAFRIRRRVHYEMNRSC